jgi:hydroxymethylglutaryl-CoA reductase (NADPH)
MSIPRRSDNDYTREAADQRYPFDPSEVAGNIENFLGVAQVPLGLAGPGRNRP